ncbi:22221_t:CDS:2 [Entrophospora sp. SA101]|nr:22221_t:CDS:2 [Entrophospora sp. SA101]
MITPQLISNILTTSALTGLDDIQTLFEYTRSQKDYRKNEFFSFASLPIFIGPAWWETSCDSRDLWIKK